MQRHLRDSDQAIDHMAGIGRLNTGDYVCTCVDRISLTLMACCHSASMYVPEISTLYAFMGLCSMAQSVQCFDA
jgi:hypothetical protein